MTGTEKLRDAIAQAVVEQWADSCPTSYDFQVADAILALPEMVAAIKLATDTSRWVASMRDLGLGLTASDILGEDLRATVDAYDKAVKG